MDSLINQPRCSIVGRLTLVPVPVVLVIVIAAIYLGTLRQPFDFDDDGITVGQASLDITLKERLQRAYYHSVQECQAVGPFRPVFWAYTELNSQLFGMNFVAWRAGRLLWPLASIVLMYFLLREFG